MRRRPSPFVRVTGALALGAAPAALLILSVVALRAEILARGGLAGWDGTLDEPRGDRASLRRAAALDPWRADLQVALGLCPGLPAEERERHLAGAIRGAPTMALAWLALGALRAEQGDEEAAMRLYRAAESLDRMGSATQIRLAALSIDLTLRDAALACLRRAARLSPEARLLEALSLAVTITADSGTLAELVPPGAGNHLAAARFLESTGLAAAAETQYELASSADPASLPIQESHAGFHLRRQERGAAIRLIRRRLEASVRAPDDLALRLQLAQLLMDEGRAGEAALEVEEAARRHPGSAEVMNQRALLELELGDGERAVAIAQALVDRRPEMAPARVTLARALWKRGDRPGAARELAQAEALDGSRAEVQLLMARLNREVGNQEEAAARYRKAIEMGYVSPAREELSALDAAARAAGGG